MVFPPSFSLTLLSQTCLKLSLALVFCARALLLLTNRLALGLDVLPWVSVGLGLGVGGVGHRGGMRVGVGGGGRVI